LPYRRLEDRQLLLARLRVIKYNTGYEAKKYLVIASTTTGSPDQQWRLSS
jgi:hypothetical protein